MNGKGEGDLTPTTQPSECLANPARTARDEPRRCSPTAYEKADEMHLTCRSLSDAVIKLAFICCKDAAERRQRLREYTTEMIEVEELRRNDRCTQILAEVDTPKWHKILAPLLPSADEEVALRRKWTKAARTKLEQKWSFLSMICALDKEMRSPSAAPLGFRTLLHSYVNASHFVHADRTSFELLWDRANRPPHIRDRLERAHAARLLSDSLWFAFGTWPIMARPIAIRPDTAIGYKEIDDELGRLSRHFQTVEAEFWAMQGAADAMG